MKSPEGLSPASESAVATEESASGEKLHVYARMYVWAGDECGERNTRAVRREGRGAGRREEGSPLL